ncbi:MAG: threonine ammonia-lyase [Actinobacteria bacterium]|nr:threonine ammonia-lyase [Actinomycetota bacterium]
MQPVNLEDIKDAAKLLDGVIKKTPSINAGWIEKKYGVDVTFKCENLQRAGSFKIRGAYNRIARLSESERRNGVVAASAGNHAQGVALAAQILGIKATIFMPEGATLPKYQATLGYGADVIFHGKTIDEALMAASAFSNETGAVFIHPFDHEHIVAGQGTMGLEILAQNPDVKTVVVCTGGGGLLAGTALAIKSLRPDIKVIGVQAEMAAAYPPSLAAGSPQMLPKMSTMADGIAVGKPGDVPFQIIAQHVDEIRTVSESSLARALLLTLERSKLQVEAGGIAAVAAILDDPDSFDGPVVASLSGGNIDPLLLSRVLRTGLAASGRFLMVQVRLTDQPGSLAKLLACVAELGTNIIQTSHTRMNPALAISEVDVELELETRGFEHREQILARIVANGFEIVTHY